MEDEQNQQQCIEINFKKKMKDIPCFFLRGAYDPPRISGFDKKLMGMVRKMIAGKKNSEITEQEQELLKAIDEGADYVDRSRIAELVRFIKE